MCLLLTITRRRVFVYNIISTGSGSTTTNVKRDALARATALTTTTQALSGPMNQRWISRSGATGSPTTGRMALRTAMVSLRSEKTAPTPALTVVGTTLRVVVRCRTSVATVQMTLAVGWPRLTPRHVYRASQARTTTMTMPVAGVSRALGRRTRTLRARRAARPALAAWCRAWDRLKRATAPLRFCM